MRITAPFMVLDGEEEAGGSELHAGTKLALIDTPGPNEAGEEGLRFQVRPNATNFEMGLYSASLSSYDTYTRCCSTIAPEVTILWSDILLQCCGGVCCYDFCFDRWGIC